MVQSEACDAMEFFGLVVPAQGTVRVDVSANESEFEIVHLTNVALGVSPKGGPHAVSILHDKQELVLATLKEGLVYQAPLDLGITKPFALRNHGPSPVSVSGFKTRTALEDYSADELDSDMEDEEDEDEEDAPDAVPLRQVGTGGSRKCTGAWAAMQARPGPPRGWARAARPGCTPAVRSLTLTHGPPGSGPAGDAPPAAGSPRRACHMPVACPPQTPVGAALHSTPAAPGSSGSAGCCIHQSPDLHPRTGAAPAWPALQSKVRAMQMGFMNGRRGGGGDDDEDDEDEDSSDEDMSDGEEEEDEEGDSSEGVWGASSTTATCAAALPRSRLVASAKGGGGGGQRLSAAACPAPGCACRRRGGVGGGGGGGQRPSRRVG